MPNEDLNRWCCLAGHVVYGTDGQYAEHPYCRHTDYMDNEPIVCGLEIGLVQEPAEEE